MVLSLVKNSGLLQPACLNRPFDFGYDQKTPPPSKAPDVELQSSWSARSPFEDTEERMNSKGNERFTEHVVKHAVKHSKNNEIFS